MKLIISSSELLRGVMAVAKAIPAKSPLPILENFLFDLKGNMLEITASDSELTLKTQVEVENTAEEGRIAVPAKHMMDLLKELPDQPLTISTSSDSSFVCSWASGESTLPYFPAEDYPEITGTDDTAVSLQFPAQSLVDGISSTIYATTTATATSRILRNRPRVISFCFIRYTSSIIKFAKSNSKLHFYTVLMAALLLIRGFLQLTCTTYKQHKLATWLMLRKMSDKLGKRTAHALLMQF